MEDAFSVKERLEAFEKVDPVLALTPRAKKELLDTLRNYPGYYVRVEAFEDGGCGCGGACACGGHGPSYAMSIVDGPFEGDAVFEVDGIRFATPKHTIELVRGSTIDYYEGYEASGFVVINPAEAEPHTHDEEGCACGGTCTCGRH